MRNVIVGKIEVKPRMTKNLHWSDVWLIVLGFSMSALILKLQAGLWVKLFLLGIVVSSIFLSIAQYNTGRKGYQELAEFFSFIVRKKLTPEINFSAQKRIEAKEFLRIDGDYTAIYEINGIDFYIKNLNVQDSIISSFHNFINQMKEGSIIKLEKKVDLDNYIANLQDYKDGLVNRKYGKEVLIDMLNIHQENLIWYMDDGNIKTNFYYFICKEKDKEALKNLCKSLEGIMFSNGLDTRRLEDKEIIEFIAEYMGTEPYVTPAVKEKFKTLILNAKPNEKKGYVGDNKKIVSIAKYPYTVGNAWASTVFATKGATVCMNFKTFGGKSLDKSIDKAIAEAGSNTMMKGATHISQKKEIGKAEALDAVSEAVVHAQEKVFDVQAYLMFNAGDEQEALKKVKAEKMTIDYCYGMQKEAFINMLPYSRIASEYKRYNFNQLQGQILAMAFPFVSKRLEDENGMYLGYNENLVFWDPFERTTIRTNSNMSIIGSSGKGKSFLLKKLILELSGRNMSIFILDPEDEYRDLCKHLEGNYINVEGDSQSRINPLQVFPPLKDEDSAKNNLSDITQHRNFLKEFFKIIFSSLTEVQQIFIDTAVKALYDRFKIVDGVDILTLANDKFPLMNDLYKEILARSKNKEIEESERQIYLHLSYLFQAFSEDGLYASSWNGYTTLKLDNPFTVLNFRELFATSNQVKANAQMLLVMRYINLELIKNLEANKKALRADGDNYVPKYIIEIIDEGHNFIHKEFPIALEKIAQTARQARKYNAGLWFATQNIADFIGGGDEVKAKASAIINNCKFSSILGVEGNDLNALIELYATNKPFTEAEIRQLSEGRRGEVLLSLDDSTRLSVQIEAFEEEVQYFDYSAYRNIIKGRKALDSNKDVQKSEVDIDVENLVCLNCEYCEEVLKGKKKKEFNCKKLNKKLGFNSENINTTFIHKSCPIKSKEENNG